MKKEDIGGLIILLVVIGVVAGFFLLAPAAPELVYAPVEKTGSSLVVTPPTAQTLSELHVDTVLKAPGFIVIHEAMGQAPGKVAAQSGYLPAGSYPDLTLPLSVPLELNQQFFALMFADDGDKWYEPGVDLPVMSEGKVIKVHFITP